MRLVCLCLVVLASACGPNSMTMDAGTTCSVPTLNPPNLARNGLFECGDPTLEFKALDPNSKVEVSTGRSGKGLKFTTANGIYGNRLGSEWKVIAPAAASYCLRVWIKSTSTATTVRFYGLTPNSGVASGNQFDMPGPVTTWSQVPPNVKLDVSVKAGDELSVGIEDKTNKPGTVIEFDDVDLWVSADGRCQESRTP